MMSLCVKCANIDCNHEVEPGEIVVQCGSFKSPLTNADRIRAMSDEELAWELMLWRSETVARHYGISSEYPYTQKTIMEWLRQPAHEKPQKRYCYVEEPMEEDCQWID